MSRIFKLHRSEAGNLLNFAKGLAILLVFLHHYSRSAWISRGLPTPALLQFSYESPIQDFALLAAAVRAGHFTEVFLRAMAHFGYVGVHLFVMPVSYTHLDVYKRQNWSSAGVGSPREIHAERE